MADSQHGLIRIDLLATNQAATGDVITLRSPDFKKSYNSF